MKLTDEQLNNSNPLDFIVVMALGHMADNPGLYPAQALDTVCQAVTVGGGLFAVVFSGVKRFEQVKVVAAAASEPGPLRGYLLNEIKEGN